MVAFALKMDIHTLLFALFIYDKFKKKKANFKYNKTTAAVTILQNKRKNSPPKPPAPIKNSNFNTHHGGWPGSI